MDNSFSMFGLTLEQTKVLFSLQKQILVDDIENKTPAHYKRHIDLNDDLNRGINEILKTIRIGKRFYPFSTADKLTQEFFNVVEVKSKWTDNWEDTVTEYMKGIDQESELSLLSSMDEIKHLIKRLDAKTSNPLWKYLILLECCTFTPYIPKDKTSSDYEVLKKCVYYENDDLLIHICEVLGIESEFVALFKKSYDKAFKRLSGYWKTMAISTGIGVAAALASVIVFQPYVLFAAPGLTGAAAVTSGLATLGGGAVAAGGLGMAGGMAVVIGGGTLLGAGAGSSAGNMITKMSAGAVLCESAKMEVILKDIVLGVQKDTHYFQEILIRVTEQMQQLRKKIIYLQVKGAEYEKRIEELEKKIEFLEKLIVGSKAYSY